MPQDVPRRVNWDAVWVVLIAVAIVAAIVFFVLGSLD